jgi:hypothetical protein
MEDKHSNSFVFTQGKRWYYRLKGENGLLENLSDDERMSYLIISFVNPEAKRFYTFFENYIDFLWYLLKTSEDNRNFHEVTIDKRAQKMRFDIDIKKYKYVNDQIIDEVKFDKVQEFLDQLIQACIEQFKEFNYDLNPKKNILLFSSHGKEKWSFHLVIDGFYCDNHLEANELYKRITQRISNENLDWLDSGIYSVNHCLRTLGSVKKGMTKEDQTEKRVKILEKNWIFKGEEIKFEYSQKPRNENHQLSLEFERCFITLTETCFPIPNLVKRYSAEDGIQRKETKADDLVLDFAYRLFVSTYGDIYSYHGTMGNIVMMMRNRPSGCPICQRVHENENGFLWIKPIHSENQILNKYEVYFDCRRSNGVKIKIGEKVVLTEKEDKKLIAEKSSKVGFRLEDMEFVSKNSFRKWK